MTDPDARDPLDPLCEFLDGDAPDGVDLSAIPKAEIAKHLLVAGVTRHLLQEVAGRTEDSVRANMVVVLADEQATHRRRSRIFGGLAAAAAVIITTFVIFKPPPSLEPLLDKIRGFVTDDLDREYEISLEMKGIGTIPIHPKLYVRGTDRYAAGLEFPGFERAGVWQGFDGTDSWVVCPDFGSILQTGEPMPVFVSSGSLTDLWTHADVGMIQSVATGIDQLENALAIFDLLAEFERDYSIEETSELASRLPRGDGQVDIIAFRHPQAPMTLPDSIRMIVEEDTGVVRTIVLKFGDLPDTSMESPFRSIRYDLVRESVQADNLYEHGSYHDPDRPVVRK